MRFQKDPDTCGRGISLNCVRLNLECKKAQVFFPTPVNSLNLLHVFFIIN